MIFLKRRAMMTRFHFNYKVATGTGSLKLTDCAEATFKKFALLGKSTQGSTTGAQLFDIDSFLQQNIEDVMTFGKGRQLIMTLKPNTQYTMSTDNDGMVDSATAIKDRSLYFTTVYDTTLNGANTAVVKGTPRTVTSDSSGQVKVILFDRENATPIVKRKKYVMLNEGSVALPYEPYTGGKPSPTPEYPQEIVSCGRKSRNLFNMNDVDDMKCVTTTQGVAFLYDPLYVLSNFIPVKQGYKIVKGNTGSKMCIFLNVNKEPILSTKASVEDGKSIEIPSGAYYFQFNVLKTSLKNNVMCNAGNELQQYEPYTDKKILDVQVTGRNLIDVDELRNENGYLGSEFTKSMKIKPFHIEKDKKYLLFGVGRGCDYSSVYFGDSSLKYGGNNYEWLHTSTGFKIFDSDKEVSIVLTAKRSATITNIIIHGSRIKSDCYIVSKFGLFELMDGGTSVPYEPYKEPQTVQLQLDELLRGIGEYKDTITKDGIVRNIKEMVLNENTGFTRYNSGKQEKTNAFISNVIEDATSINSTPNRLLCDRFEALASSFDFTDRECCILYRKQFHVRFLKEKNIDTEEKLKEWLKQNPIKIQYLLQEQILEPFENALGNLQTYNGTTIVSVDSGEVETGIEVEYAVKS